MYYTPLHKSYGIVTVIFSLISFTLTILFLTSFLFLFLWRASFPWWAFISCSYCASRSCSCCVSRSCFWWTFRSFSYWASRFCSWYASLSFPFICLIFTTLHEMLSSFSYSVAGCSYFFVCSSVFLFWFKLSFLISLLYSIFLCFWDTLNNCIFSILA